MKGCPYCGATDLDVPATLLAYPAVHCRRCDAFGPRGEDGEEAQAAWDRRPGEGRELAAGLLIGALWVALALGAAEWLAQRQRSAAAALELQRAEAATERAYESGLAAGLQARR